MTQLNTRLHEPDHRGSLKPSYDTEALKARVKALADKHPLYPGLGN
ncbi:hypothetical protein [Streptomyces sp. NPDC047043]